MIYLCSNFCYWYHVAQYYLSHFSRGRPVWTLSCFQNKTEEKIEVRPCSLLPFQMGKVLLSQLLKKLADKNQHTFLWISWRPCRSSVVPEWPHHLRLAVYPQLWYLQPLSGNANGTHLHFETGHHGIVWPSQGFTRRAVIYKIKWHCGTRDTNYTI